MSLAVMLACAFLAGACSGAMVLLAFEGKHIRETLRLLSGQKAMNEQAKVLLDEAVDLRNKAGMLYDFAAQQPVPIQVNLGSMDTSQESVAEAVPAEYRIETLDDFTRVPKDRLADCLHDFAIWVGLKREFQPMAFGIDGTTSNGERIRLGRASLMMLSAFTWVDDGVEGPSSINLHVTQEVEQ